MFKKDLIKAYQKEVMIEMAKTKIKTWAMDHSYHKQYNKKWKE
jgi:hypothetical protein